MIKTDVPVSVWDMSIIIECTCGRAIESDLQSIIECQCGIKWELDYDIGVTELKTDS